MKNLIVLIGFFTVCGISADAQIRIVNSTENMQVTDSPAFIDVSSNPAINNSTNIGKGLVFPRVDLFLMKSFPSVLSGNIANFPTRFDGMVVFNTKEGGEAGVGLTEGELTRGFWYYDNPNGHLPTGNVTGGTWRPLGSDIKLSESKDTLFIGNDTIFIGGTAITKAGGDKGMLVNVIGDSIGVSLPEGTQPGDVLTWDEDSYQWTAQTKNNRESFWLPAVNLPWNTSGTQESVDLFKIYQQSFQPAGGGGVPNAGGITPTTYGVNYISSTGEFIPVPGHFGLARDAFDYVVTYYDNTLITIDEISADGILRYTPDIGVVPSANAFISVLLIRK